MKILQGDKGHIDFAGSVEMTLEQKDKFINFLKSIFAVVKSKEVDDFRDERLGSKFFFQGWEPEEFTLLLDMDLTTEELAAKLGRTWMSVDIKRGWFISEYLEWASSKEKNPYENTGELVKQFLKEKEDLIVAKREKKKKLNEDKKRIEELKEQLDSWDSNRKRQQLELGKKLGQFPCSVDEYIAEKKQEIEAEIMELEEDIEETNAGGNKDEN